MVGVFPSAFRPGPLSEFKQRLHLQMKELASESGESSFLMPVGLFPVIDKDNGGDTAAEELVRRFKLLDFESKNIVDFYFLGWRESFSGDIRFDVDTFEGYRMAFKVAGIQKFGGNADLILVDARNSAGEVTLNFKEAVRVDLSARSAEKDFPTLGALKYLRRGVAKVGGNLGQFRAVLARIADRWGRSGSKSSQQGRS